MTGMRTVRDDVIEGTFTHEIGIGYTKIPTDDTLSPPVLSPPPPALPLRPLRLLILHIPPSELIPGTHGRSPNHMGP